MPATSPNRPLHGLLGLGLAALLAVVVGAVTMSDRGTAPAEAEAGGTGTAIAGRALRFHDRPDGGVAVTDASDGSAIATLPPGGEGFLRGAMRGLVRERRLAGLDATEPFHLTAWADGGLTLQDAATGRVLELRAYGVTNAQAFERLLTAREDAR